MSEQQGAGRRSTIGISRINETDDFELVHPRCALQRRGDYEDGMELWKADDPEGARDALRYALEGCGDNLWVHVALGRLALEVFQDVELARGHFGHAFDLVDRGIPRDFRGRIPRKLPGNRPFFDAAEGLAACYEAMKQSRNAVAVRTRAQALGSGL